MKPQPCLSIITAVILVSPFMSAGSAAPTYPAPWQTSAPVLPTFNAAAFGPSSATITNPYYPLTPNRIYTYQGFNEEEGETETSRVHVTADTRTVVGVQTRVVRDTEYVDGVLAEDTFDWYAQDLSGNVWYMGEATTAYEYDDDGNLIGTSDEGSWEAGIDGALPGYVMLAIPAPGGHYYQEFYLGEAVDEGLVLSLSESVSTGLGNFSNVLQTYETTALEPDAREYKYYAPGLGLILIEEDLSEEFADPEFVMELIGVEVIPEPMSMSLVAMGLGGLAWLRRRIR